jgi:hypothetical protein
MSKDIENTTDWTDWNEDLYTIQASDLTDAWNFLITVLKHRTVDDRGDFKRNRHDIIYKMTSARDEFFLLIRAKKIENNLKKPLTEQD